MSIPKIAKPHRVGLIGLGMAHKPHLQGLRDLAPMVQVAACYAPSAARREAFAKANPDLKVVDNLDELLQDTSIDTVLILTPPNTHLELVERCAAAGKHVLLEKPVDITTDRARKAVEAMEKAGRKLAIMFQMRFRPMSLKLAGLIREGALGELVSASARVRWWRTAEYYAQPGRGMKARDGGGVLITQAIHTLDLFQSLTGPISQVSAIATTSPLRSMDTEDIAAVAVRFANGAVGTIDATTVAYPGFPETIEFAGTEGYGGPQQQGTEPLLAGRARGAHRKRPRRGRRRRSHGLFPRIPSRCLRRSAPSHRRGPGTDGERPRGPQGPRPD